MLVWRHTKHWLGQQGRGRRFDVELGDEDNHDDDDDDDDYDEKAEDDRRYIQHDEREIQSTQSHTIDEYVELIEQEKGERD